MVFQSVLLTYAHSIENDGLAQITANLQITFTFGFFQ